MIGKFLKQILGQEPDPAFSPTPFSPKDPPGAPPRAPETDAPPVAVMHREELIDAKSRIAGYRFDARLLPGGGIPEAALQIGLLAAEAIARLAERRLAVIAIRPEDWKNHDYRQFAAPGTVFRVALPSTLGQDEWLAVLGDIRDSGARVMLPSAAAPSAALALADLVELDLADYSLEAFERTLAELKRVRPALEFLAVNVQAWPEHRFCLSRGVHYTLGAFAAAQDEEDTQEKLNQSRLVLIEMLNLLRQDAEPQALAEVAKRDPAVAVKVIAMANSPAAGLSSPVASIDQAILVLGRAHLYRWLSISMFRVGGSPRDEALLEVALRRARFLEVLGLQRLPKQEADELFLLGLLSLLDVLLGMPMDRIVARMNLPAGVASVLLRSEGTYGRYLMLAIAVERGRSEQVARLLGQMDINAEAVDAAGNAALSWAQEVLAAG